MTPTSEVVARLRERYTGLEVPPCSVCGEPLSIQSMGGGNATVYGCERHKPFDLDHYQRSRWTQYHPGDSDVLDVIDALATAERLLAEAREEQPDMETFVRWIRLWAKARFGVWITHNTAKGAFKSYLAFLPIGGGNG